MQYGTADLHINSLIVHVYKIKEKHKNINKNLNRMKFLKSVNFFNSFV